MIFTLDVGSGTQDFLLFKPGENVRNMPKAVLPSPTRIVATKIRRTEGDIFLKGYTMGGGENKRAVKEKIAEGRKVYATEKAALSFADSLDDVKAMGVTVTEQAENLSPEVIETKDVDLPLFSSLLSAIGEEMPEKLIIAVQDHGFSPDESNRVFRFRKFRERLEDEPFLHAFLFSHDEIPECYNRMLSVVECIQDYGKAEGLDFEINVIDTVFAAISGAMMDAKEFPALVINFGNGHTVGAIVDRDGEIFALFEHHTGIIRREGREWTEKLIGRFVRGELTNEEVLQSGGHGAITLKAVDVKDFVATGPNASLSDFREANPAGDVMVVGNLGMISLYARKYGEY
jgi:uncharacterized protein (DUF1786 family)